MKTLFGALAAFGCMAAAQAVTIDIDYTYDTGGFFTANPQAKVALERAATDVGAAITVRCGGDDKHVHRHERTGTVQIQWGLQFGNPPRARRPR